MPEYLSPGVYVEEIEIGAKPIEGVSTSTAGFVGMTERGPLNNPTLVTSFAEYQRTFGGYLGDDFKEFRFLPYAVEGFFSNGGQRAYISRVAQLSAESENGPATKASGFLPNILGEQSSLSANAIAGDVALEIQDTTNLRIGDILLLRGEPSPEFLTYKGQTKVLKLDSSTKNDLIEGQSAITIMELGSVTYVMSPAVNSKLESIVLDTIDGLSKSDIIVIVDDIKSEICVVQDIPDPQAKSIKVRPLKYDHGDKTNVKKLTKSQGPGIKVLATMGKDRDAVPVENEAVINVNDAIKIGDDYFLVKSIVANSSLVAEELKYNHKIGDKLTQLLPAIKVRAANEGKWGDRIQIIVKDSQISTIKLTKPAPAGQNYMELDTIVGIEKGTILKLSNGDYVSVSEVIKSEKANKVVLDKKLLIDLPTDEKISVAEFDINVLYDKYIETYKNLSLDQRHSRYINNVISPTTSNFIALEYPTSPDDPAQKVLLQTEEGEPGWKLSGGEDGKPTSIEANVVYVGDDAPEPTLKTGLFALKNIDGISIVAIPGLSSKEYKNIQSKLINHCEIMRDRFAVLDSEKKADTTAIQAQRNLFDSKYAAIYYPWISIFDPLSQKQIDMPPSGHVCGIYARSDTERGVHKAPANEVVSGALDLEVMSSGLRAIITKGQQDVLNPKGINCIRAFPGRGIRVWGARTISSDPLWHYVNVRRLFIYVEKSINDGTQWVVFEPNDEKLWARVKQTINQFLTTVWRSGALMGTTQDEAFFVKCDRSTMTQDDIDTGKLIVLIGIAPVKPAEFVIFRIAQVAKGSSIAG